MRVFAVCLVLLIGAPAVAVASPHTDGARDGLAIARTTWWPAACADVALAWQQPDADGVIHNSAGDPDAGFATYPCTITLSTGLDRYEACVAAVHEVGHLALGPQHSTDPTNVMYPQLIDTYRPCLLAAGRRLTMRDAARAVRGRGDTPAGCVLVDQLTARCAAVEGTRRVCVEVRAIHTGVETSPRCAGNILGTTAAGTRTP